jgi:hypothetical protein
MNNFEAQLKHSGQSFHARRAGEEADGLANIEQAQRQLELKERERSRSLERRNTLRGLAQDFQKHLLGLLTQVNEQGLSGYGEVYFDNDQTILQEKFEAPDWLIEFEKHQGSPINPPNVTGSVVWDRDQSEKVNKKQLKINQLVLV